MLDAAALTLGAPASALPDAALAAAGLPSAHQVIRHSLQPISRTLLSPYIDFIQYQWPC